MHEKTFDPIAMHFMADSETQTYMSALLTKLVVASSCQLFRPRYIPGAGPALG
jgi:hypothetical protein